MKEFFKALKDSILKLEEREHKIISKYAHHKLKKYHKWNRAIFLLVLAGGLMLAAAYFYLAVPYWELFVIILVIIILSAFKFSTTHHEIYHKEFKKRKIR
jgi:fatty acid desaturase